MKKILTLTAVVTFTLGAFAQGTAFTYQGRLNDGSAPANGTYNLRFALFDALTVGNPVGSPLTNAPVNVSNGLFTVTLDFGNQFSGTDRWLEIAGRTNGPGAFTTLAPRQPLTATPYAVTAGNLSGALPSANLSGKYGNAVILNNGANSFSGNGANLTALNAANLTGAVPDARLSANVALRAGGNAFTGNQSVTGGAVGIGTLSPDRPLAVQANGGSELMSLKDNTGTTRWHWNLQSGGLNFAQSAVADARLFLGTNGNVGLGTLNPQSALHVVGTVTADNFVATAGPATPVGMVLIPAGSFTMGNSIGDLDITGASPTNVTVSAFYMDVNLVSYSQWQSVYFWATNHGYSFVNAGAGKAANHPVELVDWYDTVKWCNARSQQAGRPPVYHTDAGLTQVYTNGEPTTLYPNWAASGYRLPTEAEWEKAARGGLSGQRFPWGNVINQNLANYYGATASYSYDLGPNGYNPIGSIGGLSPATSPVGSFAANGYGLYDMAGNVYEWCWDWYGTPYAGGSDPHGPAGPLSVRVLRGGAWDGYAIGAQCAYRYYYFPNGANGYFGFRCVRGF